MYPIQVAFMRVADQLSSLRGEIVTRTDRRIAEARAEASMAQFKRKTAQKAMSDEILWKVRNFDTQLRNPTK